MQSHPARGCRYRLQFSTQCKGGACSAARLSYLVHGLVVLHPSYRAVGPGAASQLGRLPAPLAPFSRLLGCAAMRSRRGDLAMRVTLLLPVVNKVHSC